MPRGHPTEIVTIRLPLPLAALLRQLAKRHRRSLAETIRILLEHGASGGPSHPLGPDLSS